MTIVEDSYYEHSRYGLVKVVDVVDGIVSLEKQDETVITGNMELPVGKKESVEEFEDQAEPASITASAEAAEFNLTGNHE